MFPQWMRIVHFGFLLRYHRIPANVVEPTIANNRNRSAPGPLYFRERRTTRKIYDAKQPKNTKILTEGTKGSVDTRSRFSLAEVPCFCRKTKKTNIHSRKHRTEYN